MSFRGASAVFCGEGIWHVILPGRAGNGRIFLGSLRSTAAASFVRLVCRKFSNFAMAFTVKPGTGQRDAPRSVACAGGENLQAQT